MTDRVWILAQPASDGTPMLSVWEGTPEGEAEVRAAAKRCKDAGLPATLHDCKVNRG